MGEGYGCGNFHFALQLQLNSYIPLHVSDKEAFLYIRLRMTPQYSIDRSQRRKDYTMLGHHACFTCEVNHLCKIPYLNAYVRFACISSHLAF